MLDEDLSLEEAERILKANLIENVGELASLDIFRKVRTGVPEVILAVKKTPPMLISIIKTFLERNRFAIISRYDLEQESLIEQEFGSDGRLDIMKTETAKIMLIKHRDFRFKQQSGVVGIITAGSSDISVAEESKVICEAMGCKVLTSYDIGIAGIHRIFKPLANMMKENVHVIIVCAGMEGTLPGVVAALVDVPVIGVPVSSGYGMGEKGRGALTTMLQSCSPGLLVVNIDNGFGAGASAALIANRRS